MSIIFNIDSRDRDRTPNGLGDSPSNFTITDRQVSTWNTETKETLCFKPHNDMNGSCTSSIRLLRLTIPYIPAIVDTNPYLCVTFVNVTKKSSHDINTIDGRLRDATFVCTLDTIQTPQQTIRVDSSNNMLDFVRGAATFAITIPVGSYTPQNLADQIEVLMNNAAAVVTINADYGVTTPLRFSIRETAAVGAFNILWNTGVNAATSSAALLGYNAAADDIGVSPVTHTSDDFVLPWIDGGDGARWAHYKSDMIQVIPFSTKHSPVTFRVFDPNGTTIPIQDTIPPVAVSPLQQVHAVFSVTPFMQDGAYDYQKANIRAR